MGVTKRRPGIGLLKKRSLMRVKEFNAVRNKLHFPRQNCLSKHQFISSSQRIAQDRVGQVQAKTLLS